MFVCAGMKLCVYGWLWGLYSGINSVFEEMYNFYPILLIFFVFLDIGSRSSIGLVISSRCVPAKCRVKQNRV